MQPHYICTGGCKGVSHQPGVCAAEGCPKQGQPLEACNCADNNHGAYAASPTPTTLHSMPSQLPVSNPYALPLAVIVAGALIAGAIMYTKGSYSGLAGLPDELPNEPGSPKIAGEADLSAIAQASGVEKNAFNTCLDSKKYESTIQTNVQEAMDAGGRGTPYSIVVGPGGKKTIINGAQPIAAVRTILDKMLKGDVSIAQASPELDKMKPVSAQDHIRGDANAPVKVVEYSDLDCPFCKQFHVTMNQVMEEYGKQGRVAWVFRHFPLEQLHPDAPRKAQASECMSELGGQQAFWNFVDKVSGVQ